MIAIDGVTVKFGGVTALSDISVRLDTAVVGIIGPNGAGKTTFLNVFSGFIRPRAGRITAFDTDLLSMAPYLRARWGLRRSFQIEQVVDELTVEDNVRVVLDPLGLGARERDHAVAAALDFTGIAGLRSAATAELDGFQRRMTELARCAVGSPRILLLDEPGAGFAETETARLRQVITGMHDFNGAMTLLIDHDVDLIETTCAMTMVLDFGSLIAYGATDEVLRNDRVRAVYLGVEEIR